MVAKRNKPSQKRKRDSDSCPNLEEPRKQVVEEGMSWWTCMMLGASQDKSRPQGRKVETKIMGDIKRPLDPDVCDSCQCIRPATPPPDSCCGSGCAVCVFDIHDQEVALWKRDCRRKHGPEQGLENETDSGDSAMDPSEYREYELKSITPVCRNTAIYRFALPSRQKLNLSIAKHIILRGKANGSIITRQYTPVSSPDSSGHFDVLIKLYEHGAMSQCISQWKVGDHVEWRGTFGSLTYLPNKVIRILMVAAGTGITPIIQVMRHIVEDEGDETTVRLLYSCRSYDEILLRDELNELALFWNVTIIYFLTQDSPDSHGQEYGETVQHGRITKETIAAEVTTVAGRLMRALVCGTRSFEDDVIAFLKDCGIEETSIGKF
ncbi:NADH-cytochrome b5 reductase-like [Diadema antillarum]|uniref:NADH-cytochrome b5 reductase-like n=1 Tax=Diadema antillarum TaxID=105358 RepID=UPI003A8A529C